MNNQAGKTNEGVATLRAQKGPSEVLVEHYRTLGTPTTNKRFDTEFEKEVNAWVVASMVVSNRRTIAKINAEKLYQRRSERGYS